MSVGAQGQSRLLSKLSFLLILAHSRVLIQCSYIHELSCKSPWFCKSLLQAFIWHAQPGIEKQVSHAHHSLFGLFQSFRSMLSGRCSHSIQHTHNTCPAASMLQQAHRGLKISTTTTNCTFSIKTESVNDALHQILTHSLPTLVSRELYYMAFL